MTKKTTSNSSSHGVDFFSLLALVFITLKLTGVINWSWWWVLAPIWGGIVIVLLFALVVLIGAMWATSPIKRKIT